MRTRYKHFTRIVLVLALIMVFGLHQGASADEVVNIKAVAGFNGYTRLGQPFPLQVTVENNGPEIKGTLEFSSTYNGSRIVHQREVQLPRGSKKKVNMYIPANEAKTYTLDLMAAGKKISSTKVRIVTLQPQEVLAGVLASDPATLNHLTGIKLPAEGQRITVINLRGEDITANSLLLDSIDLIAINNFPSSQLSSHQLVAVQAWVERGGMLVLAGGPNWQKTLSTLPAAMLPIQLEGSRTVNGGSLSGKLAASGFPAGTSYVISEGKIVSGQALLMDGNSPLIVQKEKAKGNIIYMAFDLASPPFANWSGNVSMWTDLLNRIDPHHMISAGTSKAMNQRPYQAQEMSWVLRNIPAAGLPSTATLALVLLGYLLLLGPGIYLLLKKYDRRDWGWLVIPLLAVLMFSFTYLGVFKAKGRDVFTNVISLLRLDQDSDYSRLTSYIGAFAPTKSDYTFSLKAGDLVNVLPGNEQMTYKRMTVTMVNNPASTQTPVLATVQQGDSPQVLYTDSSRWSMRCIVAEKSIAQNGEIVSDLRSNPGGISGTVKNDTGHTLSDCLVFNRYGYQRIARLGPGETTKIDISLRFSPSKGPAFNRIFERYPIQRPQNLNNAFNRDNQINRQLMEYLSYSSDLFDDPLIFLGNSAEPIDAQALGQTRGEKYYNTVIVSNLKLNIDKQGQVDVPPGIINGRFAGSDGRNFYQDSWGYSVDSGSINFNLNLPFAVSELDTQELKIYIGSNDYRRAGIMKIKIYNNKLAQWEDFSYQSTGIPLPAAKQYISDESVIKVKIGAPEDKNQSNINVSNVTLSLKGRLLTTAFSMANESSISREQETASEISEGQENQNSLEEGSKLEPDLGVPESVKWTGGGE